MRRILLVVVALVVVSSAVPARAQTCAPFTDVAASDPFCPNIQWLFNREVTFGCGATTFCPANFVRRDQMAAFLNRLADNVVFQQGGNAFGATGVLGTDDDQALDFRVNGTRVMRYEPNAISPNVVGGSPANNVTAGVRGATIAGGGVPTGNTDPDFASEAPNRVTDAYGTVGGGLGNRAGNDAGTTIDAAFASVAGGENNTASASLSTVGGGRFNMASGVASTVGGGASNTARGDFSTVGGGGPNTASGGSSTVGGGGPNTASGFFSTVAGGQRNVASGFSSTVAGGADNVASGIFSTVAGGAGNIASGDSSFAAGSDANANGTGCFVWGDTSTANEVRCDAPNRFVVRSRGGIFMWAGGSNQATYFGVELDPGATAWTVSSDRRLKENLQAVDTREVLERVLALPIATWNLKSQDPSIRHMGAMAQDFRAAFGLGKNDVGINTIDADGVALAAIQGLDAKLEAKIADRDRRIVEQAREIAELRRAVELLVARLGGGSPSLATR